MCRIFVQMIKPNRKNVNEALKDLSQFIVAYNSIGEKRIANNVCFFFCKI